MTSTFDDREREMLDRMLLNVAQQKASLRAPETNLVTFAAFKGLAYHGELMVMGRAVNGGWSGCRVDEVGDPVARKEVVDETIGVGRLRDKCPMLWVTEKWGTQSPGYNTKKSAFWRVIRAVVSELAIADVEDRRWPSSLVWTNLYKLAPEAGGNPSASLCRMQTAECVKLLELEIAEWKPKRILMLTGLDWGRCLIDKLRAVEAAGAGGDFVDFVGDAVLEDRDRHSVRIVVAKHPQGKPETPLVHEVAAAFRR